MGKFTDPLNKAPKKTMQDDLNRLLDWYEQFKPEHKAAIPVSATKEQLEKFCVTGADGNLWYRGRIVYPEKQKQMSAKKYFAANQARADAP